MENAQQNKMLSAYRHLLEQAKEGLIKADMQTWDLLGEAVDKVSTKSQELSVLTEAELNQVQTDLKADLQATAEHLNDFEKGVMEYLEMDWWALEELFKEKAFSLADPTEITILRMRMMAAMSEDNPV